MVFLVFQVLWVLLFALGLVRFVSTGEWGYAAFMLFLVIAFALAIVGSLRELRRPRDPAVEPPRHFDRPDPIE
jgi:hypothetical protein